MISTCVPSETPTRTGIFVSWPFDQLPDRLVLDAGHLP